MMVELPVSASPRLREVIASLPDSTLTVLHRGTHAIYLDVPSVGCIGILGAAATSVPCGLRLATPTVAPLTADTAAVHSGVMHLDGVALRVRRVVEVGVPRLSPTARVAPIVPVAFEELPLTPAEPESLIGRGSGLTPLGDDVVCGWVAMHRAAGIETPAYDDRVRSLLPRTTRLSATLLECALLGEVLPQFAAYVVAVGTAAEAGAAADLTAVGHTSGLGLLAGATAAREQLIELGRLAA